MPSCLTYCGESTALLKRASEWAEGSTADAGRLERQLVIKLATRLLHCSKETFTQAFTAPVLQQAMSSWCCKFQSESWSKLRAVLLLVWIWDSSCDNLGDPIRCILLPGARYVTRPRLKPEKPRLEELSSGRPRGQSLAMRNPFKDSSGLLLFLNQEGQQYSGNETYKRLGISTTPSDFASAMTPKCQTWYKK